MKHILAVDDSRANLMILKHTFETTFKLSFVTSGVQAIKFLKKNSPDLILLDIYMPQMDGLETLECMNAIPSIQCPVIIMTAATEQDVIMKALELGAEDFILKPFDLQQILEVVKKSLKIL